MSKTPIKKAAKRIPKTKEDIKSQVELNQKVEHIKDVVRTIFPLLKGVDTIYEAQTVVNALSGFISAHLETKLGEIKLNDITIDLSKEEDSKIKSSLLSIVESMKDEPAKDLSQMLERLGRALSEFGANKFLSQPMTEISITDIVKE